MSSLLERLQDALATGAASTLTVIDIAKGEWVLKESESAEKLWVILDGCLRLTKETTEEGLLRMDRLEAGELVGILSYNTKEPSFFGVEAESNAKLLELTWDEFENLADSNPAAHTALQALIRRSFMERYRRLMRLHLELGHMHSELKRERAELQATIEELRRTRHRLVQQEKLAMIGSIMPGLAHELNNPASSLQRHADFLSEILSEVFHDNPDPTVQRAWEAGLQSPLPDTKATRHNLAKLEQIHPDVEIPLLRRAAGLTPEIFDQALQVQPKKWTGLLQAFETGRFLHVVHSAARRIMRLVESLRRYSRPTQDTLEDFPLSRGIEDTLLVLNSRLRDVDVSTELDKMVQVTANENELNQVWTNLVVNGIEAMGGVGHLYIKMRQKDGWVETFVQDSGPGISAELREEVFAPYMTTKAKGGHFGLGLGLSICRAIVEKFGGEIRVVSPEQSDSELRGACFMVRLQAATSSW
ncbi:MAG: sensor histidine kinase [Verrucomicrobiales bacterium]